MSWVSPRVIRGNRGDLLSRWGILSGLTALGIREMDVFCADPQHLPPGGEMRRLDYGAIYNLVPQPAGWRALLRARYVIWTGGLDLQDDSSAAKLVHTLVLFALYRAMGLRIVVAMQGAGPLGTRPGRWLARRILARVELFIARDRGTQKLLAPLMAPERLVLGYDGIFLDGLPGPAPDKRDAASIERYTAHRPDRPLIAVNLRLWFHFAQSWIPYQFAKTRYRRRAEQPMAAFIEAMARLVAALRTQLDARIVLVSMYEPGTENWEDDLPHLEALKRRFADDADVVLADAPLGIAAFFDFMSRFDLVIGTRLHSTLTALRAGVPAIHLSYTLKGRDIFADLDLAEWAIELEGFIKDPLAVAQCAARALADPGLRARVAETSARAVARNRAILSDMLASMARRGR